jgi:hypothetical protein
MQGLKISRRLFFISCASLIFITQNFAQRVGINGDGALPNASAALDINVSAMPGIKTGLLIPRVTEAQRMGMNPLPEAAQGLMVYQTDGQQGFYYNTSGSVIPSWTNVVSNQSLRWNVIQSATGNLFLDNAANTTAFSFNGFTTGNAFSLSTNTVTSGNLLNLFSNSNAGAGGNSSRMLNINRIGVNANNGHTSTGINVSVSSTGAGSLNYGGYFLAGGGITNYGVFAKAQSGIAIAVAAENSSTLDEDQYGLYATKTGNTGNGIGYAVSGRATGTASQNYGGNFFATGSPNNFGIYSRVIGVGTAVFARTESSNLGIGYGVRSEITGSAAVNYAGFFSAKDATNNYALFVPANSGRVSLGSTSSDVNAMLSINNGHFQSQQTVPPTIVSSLNAGILSNGSIEQGSSDVGGTFTITSGGGTPSSGDQATITFNKSFSKKAKVILTPASLNAAGRQFYVVSNAHSFTIVFLVAPLVNTVYAYNYIVIDN